MKQCPKCGTTYPDDSLIYCLADGTVLTESDDQATFVRTSNATAPIVGQGSPLRVEIPQDAPTVNYVQRPPPAAGSGSSGLKIALIVGLVGGMLLIAVVAAGALIYFNRDARPAVASNSNSNQNTKGTTPSPSVLPSTSPAAANSETDQLRDQIANLEKKLNEQKNSNRPATNVPPPPDQPVTNPGTARVNSPGDGFLALRTLPSSDIGERITRIPHGANLNLGGCLPRSRVGSKTGRWCRASYGGYSGWVFDAWLNY